VLDREGSGYLDRLELRRILLKRGGMGEEEIDGLMDSIEMDEEGRISIV
jgi:Ca2+-binding EF-hand superfamily protein